MVEAAKLGRAARHAMAVTKLGTRHSISRRRRARLTPTATRRRLATTRANTSHVSPNTLNLHSSKFVYYTQARHGRKLLQHDILREALFSRNHLQSKKMYEVTCANSKSKETNGFVPKDEH